MFNFPSHNQQILLDASKQKELDENGYCIIPLLDIAMVETFVQMYRSIHEIDSNGFFPSTYSNDSAYREKVSVALREKTAPLLLQHFINYKVFTGNFIIKHQGKNTELGLHQDMTLVDESRYMGVNVWCPLCDIHEKNGAIWFLKGSNRLFPTYRGPTIPNIYDRFPEEIRACMLPIYVKAGEAIVFDHSILHFSPPNLSKEDRVAFNIFISNKDATVMECYYNPSQNEHQIELLQQNDRFFLEYEQFDEDKYERPRIGTSLGWTDYNFPSIDIKLLEEKYGYVPKKPLSRMISKFKALYTK